MPLLPTATSPPSAASSTSANVLSACRSVAESRPPDESWGPLLRALGEPLGWSGGAVFLVDDADEAMTCVEFWAVNWQATNSSLCLETSNCQWRVS